MICSTCLTLTNYLIFQVHSRLRSVTIFVFYNIPVSLWARENRPFIFNDIRASFLQNQFSFLPAACILADLKQPFFCALCAACRVADSGSKRLGLHQFNVTPSGQHDFQYHVTILAYYIRRVKKRGWVGVSQSDFSPCIFDCLSDTIPLLCQTLVTIHIISTLT